MHHPDRFWEILEICLLAVYTIFEKYLLADDSLMYE
jgi:hypothetical protein